MTVLIFTALPLKSGQIMGANQSQLSGGQVRGERPIDEEDESIDTPPELASPDVEWSIFPGQSTCSPGYVRMYRLTLPSCDTNFHQRYQFNWGRNHKSDDNFN